MDNFRRLTVITISVIFLLSGAFLCEAQYPRGWYTARSTVFRYAKEQDKYILLFVGVAGCPNCQNTYTKFNIPDSPVKKMLDDNYIVWYSDDNNPLRRAENMVYSSEFRKTPNITYPLLFIINPEVPDISVDSTWVSILWTVSNEFDERVLDFLSLNLVSESNLTWYYDDDRDDIFSMAKEQHKYILKVEGRTGSNVCRKVISQFETNPLKKLLEDNYILWYSEFDPATRANITAPFISVIYPHAPDIILESTWGDKDVETLEALFKSYTVSNETVATGNDYKVTVSGNVLQISNPVMNEQIRVFSLTGQQIASVRKNGHTVTVDASHFPKGVVIVSGSSGWSSKLLIN